MNKRIGAKILLIVSLAFILEFSSVMFSVSYAKWGNANRTTESRADTGLFYIDVTLREEDQLLRTITVTKEKSVKVIFVLKTEKESKA